MEGYGDVVAQFMNNYIRREQLLGIVKIHGLYQGTVVWRVTHKIVYIDFDVQDHVRLTRRLDDNMMYILTRVNLRNTLTIVCATAAFIHTFPNNPHDAFDIQ